MSKSAQQQSAASSEASILAYSIAGISSAIPSSVVCQPLDAVKTRLQTTGLQGSQRYGGIVDAMRSIQKKEGYKAFFRGLPPVLVSLVPSSFFYWPVLEKTKWSMERWTGYDKQHPLSVCVATFCAWTVGSVISCPLSRVKVLLQTHATPTVATSHGATSNMLTAIRSIAAEGGIRAFYVGWSQLMAMSSMFMLYMTLYESSKKYLAPRTTAAQFLALTPVISATCMAVSCVVCYPIDVVLSRKQFAGKDLPPQNSVRMLWNLARQEGVRGLYRGLNLFLLTNIIGTIVTWTIYESIWLYAKGITGALKAVEEEDVAVAPKIE